MRKSNATRSARDRVATPRHGPPQEVIAGDGETPGDPTGGWAAADDGALLAALLAGGQRRPGGQERRRAEAWLIAHGGWRAAPGGRGPGKREPLERDGGDTRPGGGSRCGGDGGGESDDRVAEVIAVAVELARRYHRADLAAGPGLTSPRQSAAYLQAELRDHRQEVFACLFLDTRHRVLAFEELFRGSIDGACVYPRVVAERALALGAAAVIAAHNHPSGVAEPSLSDQAITHRLRDALALIDVRLLDHFVIGAGRPVSLAERGLV